MVAEGGQDEERKSSGGSDDHDAINEESDEEDSNMIPDEKPDGTSGPAGGGAIGDETELDLLSSINELESQEQHLGEEVRQKEALLEKIKQQQKEMQDVLLREMREEYHKKIAAMAGEMQRLEAEKNETL